MSLPLQHVLSGQALKVFCSQTLPFFAFSLCQTLPSLAHVSAACLQIQNCSLTSLARALEIGSRSVAKKKPRPGATDGRGFIDCEFCASREPFDSGVRHRSNELGVMKTPATGIN
jgi:hypothetical protein